MEYNKTVWLVEIDEDADAYDVRLRPFAVYESKEEAYMSVEKYNDRREELEDMEMIYHSYVDRMKHRAYELSGIFNADEREYCIYDEEFQKGISQYIDIAKKFNDSRCDEDKETLWGITPYECFIASEVLRVDLVTFYDYLNNGINVPVYRITEVQFFPEEK